MATGELSATDVDDLSQNPMLRDHLPERISPSPSDGWRSHEAPEDVVKGAAEMFQALSAIEAETSGYLEDPDLTSLTPSTTVEPFIIGVAGASASGKTTVCEKIIQGLGDHRCVLVSLDWFYHSIPDDVDSADYNFDHPDALDFNYLHSTLKLMQKGEPVEVPTYDFQTHKRSDKVLLNAAEVIIVEGILTFYPRFIRKMMHMKVFVDEDPDVCLCRRIRRDVAYRGRTLEGVLVQYEKFVKRSYDEFIFPTKRYADLIVPRGGDNHVAITLIVQNIALKLKQEGDLRKLYPNLFTLRDGSQIRGLHTIFRCRNTSREDFVFYADRLIRLVVEKGLGLLPFSRNVVITPTGEPYFGVAFAQGIIGVSIIRGGEAMENSLRAVCKSARIGKMLISYEAEKHVWSDRQIVYCSLPKDINQLHVFLMDPVLDTGGTASCAIDELLRRGVPPDHITVLNLIASPEGITLLCKKHPQIKLVTSSVDRSMNANGFTVPGVGDFANRYFGT